MKKLKYLLYEVGLEGYKVLGYYTDQTTAIERQLELLANQIENSNGFYKTFHVKEIREFTYGHQISGN
jgi:hypothetical protein